MDLSRYLSADTLLFGVDVDTKQNLIYRMLNGLIATHPRQHSLAERSEEIEQAIWDREQRSPTCLGDRIAFPHARVEGLAELKACLALLNEPMLWGSEPHQLVDTVCLYLVPMQDPTAGIRFMGAAAELLSDPLTRRQLRQADTPQAALGFIHGKQLLTDGPILASDIMHTEPTDIHPQTPLTNVTHTMLKRHTDALPVCDHAGRVVGEIHCDLLFRKGIPDFFMKLASVSFIKNFDPFEAYFTEEAKSVAGDLMSTDPPCLGPDATLMEILFQLTARDRRRLYIVKDIDADRTLLGVIDRITVLDRVIHQ